MLRNQALLLLLTLALPVSVGCQRADELGPVASAGAIGTLRDAFSSGAGDAGTGAAAAATGTGWATLKGRFVFEGTPPQMQPYNANKDMATCAPGGKAPLQESVLVDSGSGGLANVAIYVRKASRVH
ncbi:MAG: hypothetical protein ACR2NM_10090, partial [Bythopirellula sp.]